MSGYSIDDEIDNNYSSDCTSTSKSVFSNSSITNSQNDIFDDDDDESENLGEPMTMMMPAENIDQLQYESEIKQVNLNTRINQIIKDHLDWYSNTHEAKMYCLPKPLVTKAVDHLTEQELSEFAQSMIIDLQDMSLLLRGEFNFSSFLDIMYMWLKITRTPNRFEQSVYEHKIVIRHDMGYKYSYLIKEVFRIITHRFNKPFYHKITENTVLIRSTK